jgi:hypothetical protein
LCAAISISGNFLRHEISERNPVESLPRPYGIEISSFA